MMFDGRHSSAKIELHHHRRGEVYFAASSSPPLAILHLAISLSF
jgi:hypothetical protein